MSEPRRNAQGQALDLGPDADSRSKAQDAVDAAPKTFKATTNMAKDDPSEPKRDKFGSGLAGQAAYSKALAEHRAALAGQKKGIKGS